MSTLRRGAEAEAEVLRAFVRLGVPVLTPFGEGHAYDLVVDLAGRLLRVQVKAGWVRGAVVDFNAHSTDHGFGQRGYHGRADAVAVFCAELERVFVVDVAELGACRSSLRLSPARNNQRRRVRLAEECTVERWLERVRRGT
jgi:hypothetical protein